MMASKSQTLLSKLGTGTIYNLFGAAVGGIITSGIILAHPTLTQDQAAQLVGLQASFSTLAALALVIINNRFKLF